MACFKLGIVIEGTWSRYLMGQASRDAGEALHANAQNLIDVGTRVAKGDSPFGTGLAVRVDGKFDGQRQTGGADHQPHRLGRRVTDDDGTQPRSDEAAETERDDRRPLHRCQKRENDCGDDVCDTQDHVLARIGVRQRRTTRAQQHRE